MTDDARVAREARGRRVREVWITWARAQPEPKVSWLVPWEELDEPQREVDCRIGSALWGDGFAEGMEAGFASAAAVRATRDAEVAALAAAAKALLADVDITIDLYSVVLDKTSAFEALRAALRPFLTEEAQLGGPQPVQEPPQRD